MKKEESRDSLIDIPAEDDRDESQLTGRKAAEYNRQHVIRHRKRVRTKILCALGILLALLAILAVIAVILVNVWRSTGRASLLQHAQGNSTNAAQNMQSVANEKILKPPQHRKRKNPMNCRKVRSVTTVRLTNIKITS